MGLPSFPLSIPSAVESRCRIQPLIVSEIRIVVLNSGSIEAKTSLSLGKGTRRRIRTMDTPVKSAANQEAETEIRLLFKPQDNQSNPTVLHATC